MQQPGWPAASELGIPDVAVHSFSLKKLIQLDIGKFIWKKYNSR